MRIKSATFSNLYSFGEGVVVGFPYAENAKTLVVGRNNDDPGADSNGAGKSNIPNSITWIILGVVFQEESLDDIIRKGMTWCSGGVTLVDEEKNIELKISRGHGNGIRKFLKVWYNGEEKTANTDTETQKVILKYLNISPSLKAAEYFNDFINTVYFSSDVVKGFLGKKTTSKERFAVIERFLNLKRYSLASERAKSNKKEQLEKVDKHLAKITEYEAFINTNPIERFEDVISDSKQTKTESENTLKETEDIIAGQNERILLEKSINTHKAAMESLKTSYIQQMGNLEKEYNNNLAGITDNNKRINEYNLAKAAVDAQNEDFLNVDAKILDVQNKISAIINSVTQKTSSANAIVVETIAIKAQLSNNQKCPGCGIALMVKDGKIEHINTDALAGSLASKITAHQTVANEITTLNDEKAHLNTELITLNNKRSDYSANKKAFMQMAVPSGLVTDNTMKTERNTFITTEHPRLSAEAQTRYGELKATLVGMEERHLELSKNTLDVAALQAKVTELKSTISLMDNQIGSAESAILQVKATATALAEETRKAAEIKTKADRFGFWETAFNEIKLDIIDEFLPDFEDRVNDYLSRLRVNMRVSFDTQKEKAGATKKDKAAGRAYKEEFNIEVFKEDNIPIPYGLLSKGQRGRLGTCVGMSLRELTKERGSNTFDFFFLDEIADALDESGLRELVRLLDETQGQKLVISHNSFLKDYFDDQIVVEMNNEISTIRQEAM